MAKELKDLTLGEVCEAMDRQQPGWELAWADARDLRDAFEYPEEQRKGFLQRRAGDQVMLVLRAAYHATWEPSV